MTGKKDTPNKAGGPRKRLEEEMRESEAQLSAYLENAPDGVYINDLEGNFLYGNRRCEEIIGYQREELVGKNFLELNILPENSLARAAEILQDNIDGKSTGPDELELISKVGRCIPVEINTSLIQRAGKNVVLAFVRDISERKKVDERLRESEGRFSAAFNINPDPVAVSMSDTARRIMVNPAFVEWSGYPHAELIGATIEQLLAHPEDSERILTLFKRNNELSDLEIQLHRKNGEIRDTLFSVRVIEIGGRKYLFSRIHDITERKLLEKELRESEERFRRLSENAPDVIYRYRLKPDAGFEYVSPATVKLTGYAPEEYYADPLLARKIVHPEDRDQYRQHFTNPQLLGTPLSLRYVHKDGRVIWAEEIDVPVYNLNGELIAYEGIVRDITGRMKAERDLQQKAELLDAAYDSIIAYDMEGKIIYANETACSLRGYTREEMLAMNMRRLVPQGELPGLKQRHKLLAEQGELSAEAVHVKKDGSIFLVDTHLRLVELAGNKLTIAVHRDITARKQMEKLIIDNEAKYRSLFEHNPAAVYAVDLRGRFTSVNAAAVRLTGYSEEEALGMSIAGVVAPDHLDTILSYFQDSLRGEAQSYDSAIKTKDGRRVDVHVTSTPIVINGDIVGVYGIAEDIGDRRRLEEEQQRVARLESVGLLAAGIAHDFNNILTSILGNISLAGTEATPGSELQNSLKQAEKASQRAKDLTQQLLTFSKGGAPVTKLASLTELIKDTTGFALRGANVKCRFSIPAGLWHAEIDEGQVSQVIHNLVINAQQAMRAGGNMEVRAENMSLSGMRSIGKGLPLKAGDYVRISVTDHGTGIPGEHLEKIFDPFFTTKQKGSGLGLATSFSIARNHGGHLSVESELGTGSTFYLYLPATTQTSAPRPDKKEKIKPAGKVRILVMDDEQGVREVAGRMLKHLGYRDIEFATDGVEAIKLYKAAMKSAKPFRVAILDLTIAGGMGGEVTVRKLLKIDPGVKAIVSSGYADDPVIAKYSDYGFSGMVAKPYTLEELGKAVHNVIG